MTTREELLIDIHAAKDVLAAKEAALAEFDAKAENNVFVSLAAAERELEGKLRSRAAADCEGSYNCGQEKYTQEFMVQGIKYIGTLKVEYNRHDKTYYYIEEASFSYAPASL